MPQARMPRVRSPDLHGRRLDVPVRGGASLPALRRVPRVRAARGRPARRRSAARTRPTCPARRPARVKRRDRRAAHAAVAAPRSSSPPMRVALLGLGLIGGSIARALRQDAAGRLRASPRGRRAGPVPGTPPPPASSTSRPGPSRPRSTGRSSSCSPRRRASASRCSTSSPGRVAPSSRRTSSITDVASTKAAIVHAARRRSGSGSWAATRWLAGRPRGSAPADGRPVPRPPVGARARCARDDADGRGGSRRWPGRAGRTRSDSMRRGPRRVVAAHQPHAARACPRRSSRRSPGRAPTARRLGVGRALAAGGWAS